MITIPMQVSVSEVLLPVAVAVSEVNIPVQVAAAYQMRDGEIIVTGAEDEQQIVAFSTEGHMLGQSISHDGSAVIPTNLQHGAIAIVKIGDKTVRIMEK